MGIRDADLRKSQVKQHEWQTEIDTLTTTAGNVTVAVRNKYHDQIESVKAKQAATRKKIEKLQQAGGSAWNDLKSGMNLAGTAMGEAIDSARSRFR